MFVKIKNINGQKAPKELYNSYYNMSLSIERCHAPETIFRKYKSNMGDSLRNKIGKSQDQDDELKNKYFDFMQMIIRANSLSNWLRLYYLWLNLRLWMNYF